MNEAEIANILNLLGEKGLTVVDAMVPRYQIEGAVGLAVIGFFVLLLLKIRSVFNRQTDDEPKVILSALATAIALLVLLVANDTLPRLLTPRAYALTEMFK